MCFLQWSTFTRKDFRFEYGGHQTCFLPRAPSNAGAPLVKAVSFLSSGVIRWWFVFFFARRGSRSRARALASCAGLGGRREALLVATRGQRENVREGEETLQRTVGSETLASSIVCSSRYKQDLGGCGGESEAAERLHTPRCPLALWPVRKRKNGRGVLAGPIAFGRIVQLTFRVYFEATRWKNTNC